MAMINIEYRHRNKTEISDKVRRNNQGMKRYLSDLVKEMRLAKISAEYVEGFALDGEENKVLINGTDVKDILNGLKIMMPDSDDHCDRSEKRMVSFGRPVMDWNRDVIEDIPDVLMKNAISKVYSDIRSAE